MRPRKPHILSATKRVSLPDRCIYFDSEARVKEGISEQEIERLLAGYEVVQEHTTFLVCADFVKKKSSQTVDFFGDNFLDDFWSAVDSFTLDGRIVYMFAHNAKYDVLACRGIPALIGLGYVVTSFSDDNPFILEFSKGEGKYNKKIVILSTTNFYQTSLKNLGKTFGIEKMDAAYNATLEDAIPYCRRDVEIIRYAMEGFFTFIAENGLGTFSKTLAGQSFNAYRARFMAHDIAVHCDELALELERDSYAGGRTECFRLGPIPEPLHYLDVNSMYPYVMLENRYPVKLITAREGGSVRKLQWYLDQGFLLCARVTLDTQRNCYPLKHKGKLIFPVGRFSCSLATPELMLAIQHDDIVSVEGYSVYHAENIFEDFVSFFYEKRLEAKAAGDSVLDYLYKIMLNSLYGKFGQKSFEWEEVGTAPSDVVDIRYIYDADRGTYKTVKIIGGLILENKHHTGILQESFNSFPAIAAHVTSYARMLLWEGMTTAGLDEVYYTDTDSIICSDVGYERILCAGLLDEKELGKMKLEKEGYFTFHGLKDYEYRENKAAKPEVKMKGINLRGLETGNTVQLDANTFITSQWMGVSSMVRKGGLDQPYFTRLQLKRLKREYSKGRVDDDGIVYPIVFD